MALLWGLKKIVGRKKRYKGRERRSRRRKKEREEEGVKSKKINKNIIKNYFLKKGKREKTPKTSLLASNWSSQFCWSFCLQPTEGA